MERHVNPEDPDLYALGALDGEEKQALEAHLRSCPACAREVDAARQRVALLGLAAPAAAPPPSVKEALMRKVREEKIPEALRWRGPAEPRPQRPPRIGVADGGLWRGCGVLRCARGRDLDEGFARRRANPGAAGTAGGGAVAVPADCQRRGRN